MDRLIDHRVFPGVLRKLSALSWLDSLLWGLTDSFLKSGCLMLQHLMPWKLSHPASPTDCWGLACFHANTRMLYNSRVNFCIQRAALTEPDNTFVVFALSPLDAWTDRHSSCKTRYPLSVDIVVVALTTELERGCGPLAWMLQILTSSSGGLGKVHLTAVDWAWKRLWFSPKEEGLFHDNRWI